MTEKLTTFDPAELLTSDKAVAAFMADAFEFGDAGYIAHALGVVAALEEWLRSRKKPDYRANSFIAPSASEATQLSRPPWR